MTAHAKRTRAPPGRWRLCRLLAGAALLAVPGAAFAGPPFLTDDPEPTGTGHWEIYGPLLEVAGRGADRAGQAGVEINYGAAPDLQLTLGLPAAFSHDAAGQRWGTGDVEASVKFRFVNDEHSHFQAAFFPGVTLPTARGGLGAGRVTALLPVWVQRDMGNWSVFGGGGLALNPGAGNRNYWTGGVAVVRQLGARLQFGIEADRQGADEVGGRGSTSLGAGATYRLSPAQRLLASGGPTLADGGGPAGYHAFIALGWDH